MQENEMKAAQVADEEGVLEAAADAEKINAANAAASTGKISDDGLGAPFFTASDVRAMSRTQVRRNLAKILKSMESEEF